MRIGHHARAEHVGGQYPWLPVCTCGHQFRGYVAKHAAELMASDHNRTAHNHTDQED